MTRTIPYPKPYALIFYGGLQDGHRPRTKMSFITSAIYAPGGLIREVNVRTEHKGALTKRDRKISHADIVKTWKNPPSVKSIEAARLALPVYHEPTGD